MCFVIIGGMHHPLTLNPAASYKGGGYGSGVTLQWVVPMFASAGDPHTHTHAHYDCNTSKFTFRLTEFSQANENVVE